MTPAEKKGNCGSYVSLRRHDIEGATRGPERGVFYRRDRWGKRGLLGKKKKKESLLPQPENTGLKARGGSSPGKSEKWGN